ncbi:Obg family GTPase CgtA [Patescibacteria group bacterium]|nr:Obg family GTPase CgtA [Patescibacteria group bacterium]MBU1844606.1 Obg family GTPase CgtA [Patescibacteria group bacterium]
MLVDEVKITIKAGNGGLGAVSFGKGAKSGPDGGNGGDGGNLYFEGSSDLTLLEQFHPDQTVSAENGHNGGKDKMIGKRGEDLEILVPIGSLVTDLNTKAVFAFNKVGDRALLCKGGTAGIGNFELRSSKNTTPKFSIPPTSGQRRKIEINLKFIADYGLIGLPSSGKSSLLNELTNAKAKTAEYHFTTLSPNLGVLPNKKIIADIPGLIEGASQGKGLGIKFLKHIQKVSLLLHCVSSDSTDPVSDYKVIRKELGEYSKNLLNKKEMILLTKSDLTDEKGIKKVRTELKNLDRKIISTSIYDGNSIENLLKVLQ